MTKKKGGSVGQSIGGIIVGFDQQIFRTTPPVNELVAKGAPLRAGAAAGGGTLTVGLPDAEHEPDRLELTAPGVRAVVDLVAGGRLASFAVDGRELIKTQGDGRHHVGIVPDGPVRRPRPRRQPRLRGRDVRAPAEPAAARDPRDGPRPPLARWSARARSRPTSGPDWPFAGWAVQRFDLGPDHLTFRLEVHGDEPMPASIGWHPYFLRRPAGVDGELELAFEAGAMYVRDAAGIATDRRSSRRPGPWDDTFTDLAGPPVLRWPGFLELTIESDCPDWVIYTAPEDALCVEPQTAPPDAINADPTIVLPDRPLIAEMTWRWRSLAG